MDFSKFSWSVSEHDGLRSLLKPKEKFTVSSLKTLKGFKRIGKNLLVREADEDFWSLKQNNDGSYTVEKLIDEEEVEENESL